MADIQALDAELNRMILEGQALDAFDKFYAADVRMQENRDEPMIGHAANPAREVEFFGSIGKVHVQLLGSAVSEDVSYSEWIYEIDFKDGRRVCMTEVSARRWRHGLVVHERFYHNPAA